MKRNASLRTTKRYVADYLSKMFVQGNMDKNNAVGAQQALGNWFFTKLRSTGSWSNDPAEVKKFILDARRMIAQAHHRGVRKGSTSTYRMYLKKLERALAGVSVRV